MPSSSVYPGLERKPGGPDNWVEAAGGLPKYIERIAKRLHYEKGMTISHAIATAVNTVKRWMRMGKVAKYGDPNKKHVTAKTAAQAAAAYASWLAKRKAGKLALSEELLRVIDMTMVSEEFALDLAEEFATSVEGAEYGTLHASDIDLTRDLVDLKAMVERAGAIEDPVARATARQKILDLAVPSSKLTAEKRRQYAAKGQARTDGSFPIFDRQSLQSAVRLAKTPAERAHVIKRARALGALDVIPDEWKVDLVEAAARTMIDLASTIPPKNARGRAKDGRKSFKGQGKWKHGFVPATEAAAEAKAKGSPIAMKRMKRLFGKPGKDEKGAPNTFPNRSRAGKVPPTKKAAQGRAGDRSAGSRKSNPDQVKIEEKSQPGSERAKDIAHLRRTKFEDKGEAPSATLPETQKEASKSSRIPERARQDWNEIPDSLKTVRNGKRYVVAEFGGKQYVTEWIGGVKRTESSALAERKVMRTLASADAANMSQSELRALVNNPRSPESVRKTARKALRAKAKVSA